MLEVSRLFKEIFFPVGKEESLENFDWIILIDIPTEFSGFFQDGTSVFWKTMGAIKK